MSQDELLQKIIKENESNFRRLVEQLKTPIGVIPFVGAGLSIPFDFLGWTGFLLSNALSANIEEKIRKCINDGKYEEAAEDLLDELKNRAFNDAIESEFGNHKLEGKELVEAVSFVPKLTKGPVITTNFDHVLETVFANDYCPFEEKVWGARVDIITEAFHQNRRVLLKIHGDWKDRTDRILTLTEYKKHYGDSELTNVNFNLPLPKLLRLMLTNRPVLFLGCSLNKDRTVAILKQIAIDFPAIAHYAIVEKPLLDEEFREKDQYLSEHGIRPIWYPSGQHDLVQSILAYLVEQMSQVVQELKPPKSSLKKEPTKILFLSALGQWTPGLQKLIEASPNVTEISEGIYRSGEMDFKIFDWDKMSMEGIEEIKPLPDGSTYIHSTDTEKYPPGEWLYVFVAPLPLAAKFRHDHHLSVLGPAFSTDSDVTVYVRPGLSYNRTRLRIGVIQDDITSTIMLKILLCLIDDLFDPEPTRVRLNIECLDSKYNAPTYRFPAGRMRQMDPTMAEGGVEKVLDACIFTSREYKIVSNSRELRNIVHRKILKVDPPVAHYLNLEYVPRAVYFLHKSHYQRENAVHTLLRWLSNTVNCVRGGVLPGGMMPLLPWSEIDRGAQQRFIKAAIETRALQDIEDFSFVEILAFTYR